jgi:hypothetical protein
VLIEQALIVKFRAAPEGGEVRARSPGITAALARELELGVPGPGDFDGPTIVIHRSLGADGHWIARSASASISADGGVWSRCYVATPPVWAAFGRDPDRLLAEVENLLDTTCDRNDLGSLPALNVTPPFSPVTSDDWYSANDSTLSDESVDRLREKHPWRGRRADGAHEPLPTNSCEWSGSQGFTSQELESLARSQAQMIGEAPVTPVDPLPIEFHPADTLGRLCPEMLDRLELLDDTVFDAIAGRPHAVERLRKLWPQVQRDLPASLVEESRSAYTAHAMAVWQQCVEGDQIRSPRMATTATDVLEILLSDSR